MATGLQPVVRLSKREEYCMFIVTRPQIYSAGFRVSERDFNTGVPTEEVMT